MSRPLVVALALAICGLSGYAIAQSASTSSNTVTACAARKGGALRIAKNCRKTERRVTWAKAGAQGLPGTQGTPGAQGAAGKDGTAGTNGTTTGETYHDSASSGSSFGGTCEASPSDGPSITFTAPAGSYIQIMASSTMQRSTSSADGVCLKIDSDAGFSILRSTQLGPDTRYMKFGDGGVGTTSINDAHPIFRPIDAGTHTISLVYTSTGGTSQFNDRNLYVTLFHPTG